MVVQEDDKCHSKMLIMEVQDTHQLDRTEGGLELYLWKSLASLGDEVSIELASRALGCISFCLSF